MGTMIYDKVNKFSGEWKDNKKNGKGILVFAKGFKYEGEFKDNLPNGKGTITQPDGTKIKADWKDGMPINYYKNGVPANLPNEALEILQFLMKN
jgi:hypothetical protein